MTEDEKVEQVSTAICALMDRWEKACDGFEEPYFDAAEVARAAIAALPAQSEPVAIPAPDLVAKMGPRYRHKKRGTEYEVIAVAELQCASGLNPSEGDGLMIYRGDDGKVWARIADEFHDGRFELVTASRGEPDADLHR